MRGDVTALSRIQHLDDRALKVQDEIRRAIKKRELKKQKKKKLNAPVMKRLCRRAGALECCLWPNSIKGSVTTDKVQTRLYKARRNDKRLFYVSNVSDVAVVCAPRNDEVKLDSLLEIASIARGDDGDDKNETDPVISEPLLLLAAQVDCSDVLYEASDGEKNVHVRALKADGSTVFILCGSTGVGTFGGESNTAGVTPRSLGLDRELLRQLQNAAMLTLALVED